MNGGRVRLVLIVNSELLLCLTEPLELCLCLISQFAGILQLMEYEFLQRKCNTERVFKCKLVIPIPHLTSQQPNGKHFISSNISIEEMMRVLDYFKYELK